MKWTLIFLTVISLAMVGTSCRPKKKDADMNIIFLHHSTGSVIWRGEQPSVMVRAANKISARLANAFGHKARLPQLFEAYNNEHSRAYRIEEANFPKSSPYGWHNYPFDYYNIWVQHAGLKPFQEEPTLEMLTQQHQVVIFKHCFPVSNIQPDSPSPNVASDYKSLANYRLQYLALRDKLHEFPSTKFILFTGAAQVQSQISEGEARRAREFFEWVVKEWDLPGDNIFLWDLYQLQTEGGIYLKESNARAADDSHPSGEFAAKAVQLLFNRIVDVIEHNGTGTRLTGERI